MYSNVKLLVIANFNNLQQDLIARLFKSYCCSQNIRLIIKRN